MQQDQPGSESIPQPLYWDNHRVSFNLTLIFALVVAVLGFFSTEVVLMFAGIGVAAYTWLTSPRRYMIYENALVIEYGRPRTKAIDFSNISHLEMLSLGIGDRLRVVLVNGKRTMVMARDLETFREKLDEAMDRYQGQNPPGQSRNGGSQQVLNDRIEREIFFNRGECDCHKECHCFEDTFTESEIDEFEEVGILVEIEKDKGELYTHYQCLITEEIK